MNISDIVLKCANELNARNNNELWDIITLESPYFHPKSALDSLLIVDLIVMCVRESGIDTGVDEIFANGAPKTLGELAQAIERKGRRTKLVIVDCDNTLWNGIASEGKIKFNDSFVANCMAWKERGCLLALCSKNDIEMVQEVFEESAGIGIELSDFVTYRINWNDKAENVADILSELNLLPENVVFLDDTIHERERVAEAIPGIWCPKFDRVEDVIWMVDATIPKAVSVEDRKRTELYRQEAKRKEALAVAVSEEEWIKGLGIEVTVRTAENEDEPRAAELIQKAHQFKTVGCETGAYKVYVAEYKDKYGDAGIVGVVGVAGNNITQFVLSCRVMGRGVEGVIYRKICILVGGSPKVLYTPTDRNHKAVEWAKKVNGES